MKTVLAVLAFLPALVQQPDEVALFKAWLDREHPGYHSDEGPAPFKNPTVEAAYPKRRFYYVLTFPRGAPPLPENPLTLVAQVDDHGTVQPLGPTALGNYRRGLRQVRTKEDAQQIAAAVLILAFGDPSMRSLKIDAGQVAVKKSKSGWVCTYSHGGSYVSRVTFDANGVLSEIQANSPPVG